MRLTFLTILLLTISCYTLIGQDADNIMWSSFSLTKTLDAKNSVAFKPIMRHINDISDYQNFSLDASYRRKFGKGWHAQFVTRYWFIPDNTDRYFMWYDIGYGTAIKKSKLSSHIRFHNAIDIKDQTDPDFFRWKTKWTLPAMGKFTLEMSLEPWYRVDAVNEFVRMRYEPGINYKIANNITLQAVYRRENNKGDAIDFNAAVINLGFKL